MIPKIYLRRISKILEIVKKYSIGKNNDSKKEPFIFIIDEINRGESSKIFGELFYAIDPGYRGIKGKVKTQYQNLIEDGEFKEGFYVPENVYIIGTMNDIDRSVESMDFAFRRRFAWKEINAKESAAILDSLKIENISDEELQKVKEIAKLKMANLNDAICQTQDLNNSYCIGGAYFKKIENYFEISEDDSAENSFEITQKKAFEKLWNFHIKVLLTEYLRGTGDENKIEEFEKVYLQ